MNRIILLILLFAIPTVLAAQPGVGGTVNSVDAQGRKQGTWVKTWPSGKVRYEGAFKDDRPIGEFKHYDEDGVVTSIQQHVGDGKVSRARHFHPNGALMATGKYVAQKKDSTWNYFDASSQLRKVERYAKGVLHGVQEVYYANGRLAEQENLVEGFRQGESKSWFDSGVLKSEATYAKGEPEGKMTFYYPSGKKEIEGNMVNGDRDGTWYYFNTDGSLQLQVLYRKGVLVKERKENGTFKEYYDDEQLMSEVNYKAGKREGPFVEYHNNGRWVVKAMPSDPVMGTPSDMERKLEGQTRKREGTYRNDQLEGDVKEYDEKGKQIKVTRYAAGEVVGKP
jgi:antitoxin component YwqK of YwqJK toxin-antitoxin module